MRAPWFEGFGRTATVLAVGEALVGDRRDYAGQKAQRDPHPFLLTICSTRSCYYGPTVPYNGGTYRPQVARAHRGASALKPLKPARALMVGSLCTLDAARGHFVVPWARATTLTWPLRLRLRCTVDTRQTSACWAHP